MNIIQEIFDDARDGNIVNIQFVSFNKEKQQVEWSLELGKFNLVGRRIQGIQLNMLWKYVAFMSCSMNNPANPEGFHTNVVILAGIKTWWQIPRPTWI